MFDLMHPELVERIEKEEKELKETEDWVRPLLDGSHVGHIEEIHVKILIREIDSLRSQNRRLLTWLDKK